MSSKWIPEIMYEETTEEGVSSNIPFILVPKEEQMPKLLFMFESRETDEKEPGPDGEDLPIYEWDLHQYANMLTLKEKLPVHTFDIVRQALGLEPINVAAKKGAEITQKIRSNLS